MKNYDFNFEVKDLLTQFIAAFDDVIIKRYDNKNPAEEVSVRYVLAPKQRVMYDIVNKAQNLTLPVVAIDVTSISLDQTRVFNKLNDVFSYQNEEASSYIKMPVPININVNMSILARYMQDMDQIISNFVQNTNPYIIISWREPSTISNNIEIRTEVLWGGNISMSSPSDTTYNDKFRIIGDTTFTIKGWLFRNKHKNYPIIYEITEPFYNLPDIIDIEDLNSGNYDTLKLSLSAELDKKETIISIPKITNVYYNTEGDLINVTSIPVVENTKTNKYNLIGDFYDNTTISLLLSSNDVLSNTYTTIDTKYSGSVSGYLVDSSFINVIDNNILSIAFPPLSAAGLFDIVIVNPAGFSTSYNAMNLNFQSKI